uniref:Histone chaperone asf1 n=1 Tax=Parastrongyloides trichosuri TaxID=131310 RepID=A0A0N4ZMR6_PARTI
MASLISVTSVELTNNPAPFNDKLHFSITFNCVEAINKPLSFDIVYIGCPNDTEHDQVLDTITVPEVTVGNHTVTVEVDPPVADKIPKDDFVGVTAIMLKAFYNGQLFNKISWYCVIEYTDPELMENKPENPIIEKLQRRVIFDEPRNVIYNIKWHENDVDEEPTNTEEVEESDVIVFSCEPSEFDLAAEGGEAIDQEMEDDEIDAVDESIIEEDDDNKSVDLDGDSDISMDEDDSMLDEEDEDKMGEAVAETEETTNEEASEETTKEPTISSEPFSDKTNDNEVTA